MTSTPTRAGVERLTAAESEDLQRRIAGGLAEAGLRSGDRVAFVASSSGLLLSGILGALRTGIIPVVLNPALLPEEQAMLIVDAAPACVVRDVDLTGLALGAPVDLAAAPLGRPMHYTSGTTGTPKGVWSGVLTEEEGLALAGEETELWRFDERDVHLVCSPLHHSAPIRFGAGTLLAGGTVLILKHFDAALAASVIRAHRPTTAFMVPAHLQRLFGQGELPDLKSFRLLAHAGAPCPPALKRAALAAFPTGTVWEFYGSTEGQFTACSPLEWIERPGTVGRARAGRALAIDGDGTIWCEVPAHARWVYWRDEIRTEQAWRGDAFSVGDVGRLDGDGYLWVDGRRDDLIISGGVNVYPMEVEQALGDLSGIDEIAVFGVPDDRWGQRVCVAVIGDADPGRIIEHARSKLAAYKCPKDVYEVTDLPRTSTGKVRRSEIARALGLEEG